jgi:hypothetical protein
MPAKAGIQSTRHQILWIPAFAGMTVCIAENSSTAQLIKVFVTGINAAEKKQVESHSRFDVGFLETNQSSTFRVEKIQKFRIKGIVSSSGNKSVSSIWLCRVFRILINIVGNFYRF